ncbi:unnamed protein product, partial [Mesorhabditis spiculigera]
MNDSMDATPYEDEPSSSGTVVSTRPEDGEMSPSEKPIRRSAREIRRPKFDDEIVESIPDLRITTKRQGSENSLHSPSISQAERPDEEERQEKEEEAQPVMEEAPAALPVPAPAATKTKSPEKEHPKVAEKLEPTTPKPVVRRRSIKTEKEDVPAPFKQIPHQAPVYEPPEKKMRLPKVQKDTKIKEIAMAAELFDHNAIEPLKKWSASDDVKLLTAGVHVCDIAAIHIGVRFSKSFTLSEIEERWYQLMYDDVQNKVARKRFSEMKPEDIQKIQSMTIFTVAEEDLIIAFAASRANVPQLEDFERLRLDKHEIFHPARTAQVLLDHFHQMKMYGLLDTTNRDRERQCGLEKIENTFNAVSDGPVDEVLVRVTSQIVARDTALRMWSKVSPLPVTGICRPDRFEKGVYARLNGRVTRYNIKSEKVTLGRSTAEAQIDVNLALEGPALKISRKQAVLERRSDGWWLQCIGQRPMVVDSRALLTGESTRIHDGAIIEIAFLRLQFRCATMLESGPMDAAETGSMAAGTAAAAARQ